MYSMLFLSNFVAFITGTIDNAVKVRIILQPNKNILKKEFQNFVTIIYLSGYCNNPVRFT